MEDKFSRIEIIIGKENLNLLKNKRVAIFGIGGVGSYVLEGLARSGIEKFVLVDNDKVAESNINRQIIATTKTIGRDKVEVAKERVLEINPDANIEVHKVFYLPDCEDKILDTSIDYIVDAIDTVSAKIELIMQANKLNIPIISSMGTGNKVETTKIDVTDIYKTTVCPLAKVMRKELKKREIKKLKVVYSKEEPIINKEEKHIGSVAFVPSVAGLIIAGEIIKDLINMEK